MVQAVSYDSTFDLVPAIPGMLADLQFRDVVSIPCGSASVPFGCAVYADPVTGRSNTPATGNFQGVALHDHNLSGRFLTGVSGATDVYVQYDAISCLRRGRVWVRVGTAITKEAQPVTVETATGLFGTTAAGAGFIAVPNARFLSANISIVGVLAADTAVSIAMLELHEPTI